MCLIVIIYESVEGALLDVRVTGLAHEPFVKDSKAGLTFSPLAPALSTDGRRLGQGCFRILSSGGPFTACAAFDRKTNKGFAMRESGSWPLIGSLLSQGDDDNPHLPRSLHSVETLKYGKCSFFLSSFASIVVGKALCRIYGT